MSKKLKFELIIIIAILIGAAIGIKLILPNELTASQSWKLDYDKHDSLTVLRIKSPTFSILKKYKSMEGPVSGYRIPTAFTESELLWLIAYDVRTLDSLNTEVSDDFICHNNLDYDHDLRQQIWKGALKETSAYPRLITITQGQTSLAFPKGFGFPFFPSESFSILTQVLNHNLESPNIDLMHETQIKVLNPSNDYMKPLFERSVFVMLPFDTNQLESENSKSCIPVNPMNHRYDNDEGGFSTGHWVVKPGKSSYSHNITKMLDLSYSTTLHYAGAHAHPFSERLILKDITMDSIIFTLECTNFMDKVGLKKIESFSNDLGILFSHLHEYELIVEVNNTTDQDQDMMASMFLYFYDAQIDDAIKEFKY